MKKMKKVLFMLVFMVFLSRGEAFAQFGWGPWGWGGNEAARVVASNQAMIWGLANQWQQPWYPYQGQSMVAPPGYQMVCRPKSAGHQTKDIIGLAAVGAGLGGFGQGWRGAGFGSIVGTGGGMLLGNHEQDCYLAPIVQLVQQSAPSTLAVPPPQPQLAPATQPSAPFPAPVVEAPSPRMAGVEFSVINESQSVVIVEQTIDGKRVVLQKGARAQVLTPDIRVFLVQPDGRGSFDEFEIELETTQDSTLPGWRIPASVKLKSP